MHLVERFTVVGELAASDVVAAAKIRLQEPVRIRERGPRSGYDIRFTALQNAFGELELQTDAKGQQVDMDYDALGRVSTRTDVAEAITTTWTWDIAVGAGAGRFDCAQSRSGWRRAKEPSLRHGRLELRPASLPAPPRGHRQILDTADAAASRLTRELAFTTKCSDRRCTIDLADIVNTSADITMLDGDIIYEATS